MLIGVIGLLLLVGLANIHYYRKWVYRDPRVLNFTGSGWKCTRY